MSPLSLSEALDLFLLEDRAASTRMMYAKVLRRTITFLGPNRPVDSVTREGILHYINSLREQPAHYANHPRRPIQRGGLAPRTIEKHVRTTVTFFRWLEEHDYIERQPASKLRLRRWRRPPGSSKAVTPEELRAMLHIAESKAKLKKPRHLAVFLFICDTACRAGEAASLVIGNLLLNENAAWVQSKGDKVRPVFFGDRTAAALQIWLDQHPNPVSGELLFQLNSNSLSQVIRRMGAMAGLTRSIGAHAIRHRVGQVWAVAQDEQATQLKLGHDDPGITIEMYYNTTWEQVKKASQDLALAAIFGIPSEPEYLPSPKIRPLPQRKTS